MAKKATQLDLIDVDDPRLKTIKKHITEYESLREANREQHGSDRDAEKMKRKKIFESIESAGLKPDSDGVYHITLDGKVYDICQDSQLKIKKHNAPSEEKLDGGLERKNAPDAGEGKEPAAVERRAR